MWAKISRPTYKQSIADQPTGVKYEKTSIVKIYNDTRVRYQVLSLTRNLAPSPLGTGGRWVGRGMLEVK